MPGKPDIVLPKARLIVFCDGDFWHGRDWSKLKRKLTGEEKFASGDELLALPMQYRFPSAVIVPKQDLNRGASQSEAS